jgi:CBS domain-containing protein
VQPELQKDSVKDVMTGWVVIVAPTDSILKARNLMTENRVSQLVVVDEKKRPTGLISKRDIARFLLEDTTTRKLDEIPVFEASSKSIPTIRADTRVFSAARMFDTDNLTYAVVTNDNPLSGIVTETDLCHYFSQKYPGKSKVKDFMESDFIFAKSSYSIVHVAHAIVFRQPSVPVIDEELVGILTLSDLLSIRERMPKAPYSRLKPQVADDMALITTKDLMTLKPVTTREETDLAQAAQVITNKGVSSLPVIDSNSRVIGLLTKRDIVKALGRVGGDLILEA